MIVQCLYLGVSLFPAYIQMRRFFIDSPEYIDASGAQAEAPNLPRQMFGQVSETSTTSTFVITNSIHDIKPLDR